MTPLKSLLTIFSLMILLACGPVYDHPPPGVPVSQWNRDLFECKQAAVRYIAPGGYYDNFTKQYYQSTGGSYEDVSVVIDCMHAKGYVRY